MASKSKGGHLYIGKCDGCEERTSLVRETHMCGPCTTGEDDTAWPNGDDADFAENYNRKYDAPKADAKGGG